jgi:putative endonuclease
MADQQCFVYIMTNIGNSVLYTGVTSNLRKRVYEHQHSLLGGFSAKYMTVKLVYFEEFADIYRAIVREKQLKAGSRKKKIALIEAMNPDWQDLSAGL